MNEYGIWLSFNNQEEGFQIPITPGAIEIGESGQGKTYDIEKLGEINVIKNMKLSEYSFSGIFPSTRYPFVSSSVLLQPKTYVDYILKWMGTKRPIRFIFTGKSFDINTPASIDKFDWKETAGRNGDIEYSLKLKKYTFYSAKRVNVVQESKATEITTILQKEQPSRPNDKETPSNYKIKRGDTLWIIAKKTLGDGSKWKDIQKENNIKDSDLKKLQVGRGLSIPGGTANA
ncbi:LysM peptidoglycan-binding domain-containing protein [Anaerophilus nitritogenes]|uniref:LysM peptidoglycan-binding domain-containing protein n=1 Tax=Anaerophilus nitritogenes TaxID=2498136 RepID=UPI00101D20C7|nr:LysM peptidoglycan-binding domain-containing protein [Anaerophilus nitritogenes]